MIRRWRNFIKRNKIRRESNLIIQNEDKLEEDITNNTNSDGVILMVQFEEKDKVKPKGARWNANIKMWWCFQWDIHTFKDWMGYMLKFKNENEKK